MPKGTLRTDNIKGHVAWFDWRQLHVLLFWALAHMPLAEAFWLRCLRRSLCPSLPGCGSKNPPRATTHWRSWLVLGVAVILSPNVFGVAHDWPLYALAVALLGAMLMALSQNRHSFYGCHRKQPTYRFYFAIISSLLTLPLALSNWHPVPAHLWVGWCWRALLPAQEQLATTKGYRITLQGDRRVRLQLHSLWCAFAGCFGMRFRCGVLGWEPC